MREIHLAGVLLPPLLLFVLLALPLFLLLRRALWRGGVLPRAWHPALFELALFLILLSLMGLYV